MTLRALTKKTYLDKFTCSPIGPSASTRAEFVRVVELAKVLSPPHSGYVGTDGADHYFQQRGNPQYLVIPVADDVAAEVRAARH